MSMERVRPKKSFGQNFLTDRAILTRIVAAAGVRDDEPVLEIGPGKGALTRLLAEKAQRVVAVEADPRLVPLLQKEFAATTPSVEIVHGDVLRLDLPAVLRERSAAKWRVVANLPYNISSQVLFLFLDHRELFTGLTVMLQKEVGERLAAPPACGDYGILTVLFGLHFDVVSRFIVKPGAFFPAPKVDSIVVSLQPLPGPRVEVGDEAVFRRVVKGAFSTRRKTLRNALRATLGEETEAVLREAGIDPGRRGETLSLAEFGALSRAAARR